MNPRSLTFRLVSWYCGLLFALGAAFAVYAYASFDRYVEQATRATLAGRADAAWAIVGSMLDDKAGLTRLIEQRFAPEAQNRFIRISRDGTVYYRSGVPDERTFDPADVPRPSAGNLPRLERRGDLFIYAKQFTAPDGGAVTIESGRSADMMERAGHHLLTSLVIGLPLILVFAATGGWILVRRALAPVQGMIEAAEAFTFNSPRRRLPLAGTEDRIDALGKALNRMLERLDNSYQHASRFSADAAHELRTPLAIMRGELELLAGQCDLPPEMQNAVASILGETMRLSQIVENLLAISRLDSVTGKRVHRAIDLHALATETIDHMRLLAVEKSIDMGIRPESHAALAAGDRDRLKQVLVNLLDNAIKYTANGGRIEVLVAETQKTAILTVSDTGIGIAPEHLPYVFDRFFRASTERGEVGAGLGLAIVRSICAAHGGTVTVESRVGSGSIFRVELPRATDGITADIRLTDGRHGRAEAA